MLPPSGSEASKRHRQGEVAFSDTVKLQLRSLSVGASSTSRTVTETSTTALLVPSVALTWTS